MSLASQLIETAGRHKPRTALVLGDQRFRYGELLSVATRLAAAIDASPDPATRVGLLGSHSIEAYAGALAAVLGGRSFVPMRADDPDHRLVEVLRRARPSAIVCDDATRDQAERLANRLQPLPQVITAPQDLSDAAEPIAGEFDGEAYLMHTSGSTGVPKGVPVSAANLRSVLDWAGPHFGFTDEDRFAQTFEPTFDLWVFTTFAAWSVGATVIDLAPTDRFAPGELLDRENVTVWFSTPTHARVIRQLRGLDPGAFGSLRWSLFCGEALTMDDVISWQQAAPASQIENLYGPTEVTQVCASYRFPRPAVALGPDLGSWAPIGRVFPHLTHLVVDESGLPVPDGETGELWIAGSQVFNGYLGSPEDDDRSFAVATAATGDEARFYRTGDLVRQDGRGLLRFVGRVDSQVKVMGHRIELGELEAHALSCAEVTNAAAAVYTEGTTGFDRIGLAVVGAPGAGEVVRSRLEERVPAFMLPERIIEIQHIPTTPSGKLDRRHLAELVAENVHV